MSQLYQLFIWNFFWKWIVDSNCAFYNLFWVKISPKSYDFETSSYLYLLPATIVPGLYQTWRQYWPVLAPDWHQAGATLAPGWCHDGTRLAYYSNFRRQTSVTGFNRYITMYKILTEGCMQTSLLREIIFGTSILIPISSTTLAWPGHPCSICSSSTFHSTFYAWLTRDLSLLSVPYDNRILIL